MIWVSQSGSMLPRKDHTDRPAGDPACRQRGDARGRLGSAMVFMIRARRDRVRDLGPAHQDNLVDGDCRVDLPGGESRSPRGGGPAASALAAAAFANGNTVSFRDATIRFGDNNAFRLLEATCMNELQRYPADGMSAICRALRARTAWMNPSGGVDI